jgi:hypothetical protein
MTYLFFDTETTGKKTDSYLVQVCARLMADNLSQELGSINLIVNNKVPIPKEASEIHGITEAIANAYGVRPRSACSAFFGLAQIADSFVCHNYNYDDGIMTSAFQRSGIENMPWKAKSAYCTMLTATPDMRLPNPRYPQDFKWPRLGEALAFYCPGTPQTAAHTAWGDVNDCLMIFREMRQRRLL